MKHRLILLLLAATLLLFSVCSFADAVPTQYDAIFTGDFGGYLTGEGNGNVSGWLFGFQTAYASSWRIVWSGYGPYYFATYSSFGPGGTFTLEGPDGELFLAQFQIGRGREEGAMSSRGGLIYVDQYFDAWLRGTWNNGEEQALYLQMNDRWEGFARGTATLTFLPVPEPAGLGLVAIGCVGLWRTCRRIARI